MTQLPLYEYEEAELRSPVREFCEERGIPESMRNAFAAYLRSTYSLKFAMESEGETVRLIVARMTQEQLAEAWGYFVAEFKKYLT